MLSAARTRAMSCALTGSQEPRSGQPYCPTIRTAGSHSRQTSRYVELSQESLHMHSAAPLCTSSTRLCFSWCLLMLLLWASRCMES